MHNKIIAASVTKLAFA